MPPTEPGSPAYPRPARAGEAERLAALQELTDALACATSEDALFHQTLGILQTILDLPSAALLLLDTSRRMRFRSGCGLPEPFIGTLDAGCPWAADDPQPQPILAEDLRQDPALGLYPPAFRSEDLGSAALVPIQGPGGLLGEFLLFRRVGHPLTSGEIRFATSVANLVGLAVARTRQEQSLAEAKAFSDRLVHSASILVVGLDRAGRVVVFNETAEQTTGYRREEILGRDWFQTLVPRDRFPDVWDHFQRFLDSGAIPAEMETPLLTRQGQERLVSWRNSVFPEPDARVATLSFGADVTEARRNTESLRASQERFSKIFHLSPDAIDLTRLEDGVSLDCNQSYTKLSGYSREEIIGHSTLPGDLGVWVRKSDRDRHIAELRERGEVFGLEVPLRRKDGSVYIAFISSAILELNGQLCNLTLTRDITERKKAEEALRASEEKFSKTFRLSPDAISINRLKDGVYLDVNRGFTDITGYAPEEVIGRSSLPGDLGTWVSREDRERMVAALVGQGELTGLEAQFHRKDGSVLTGLLSARLIELDSEPCVLTVTRDISERKRAEEALRELNQRLELALASSHLGIWDRDLRQQSTQWDERMFELYGLDRRTFIPTFEAWLREVVHPADADQVREAIRAAEDGEAPYVLGFRIIRPDGSVRHIQSNGIVIRDGDGRATRVIGINRDRTEQVEAEAERRRLQAEVHHAEKLESIGSLAGGVAHDMNNVLTAILVTAEMLRGRMADDEPMARSLNVILHAGQRGRDLVKALTDFARKGLEEASSIDLNEVLRKEVELLRHTTLMKIRVVLDLDETLPPIQGAASELGSAIMNLSVNAVDAMPEGGTLTFRSRTLLDGWIELAVADTGQGMPPEVLARAMEPFFTTKPVGKGTGLGLSRVYGTIRAHGGTVEVRSQPGLGTTVVLRLPTRLGGLQEPEPSVREAPETRQPSLRILLVDDEGIILETISALLESLGHAVETAPQGEEALRRLDSGQVFDLVLLDHNMPGLTGAETLVQLRTRRPELPVILSTGFMDAKTEDLLANIPCTWILKKPYDRREIQRTLTEISRVLAQG